MSPLPRLLLEAVVFLVVACAAGLLANSVRGDGLRIGRDYFAPPDHGFQIISADELASYLPYLEGQPEGQDSGIFLIDARKPGPYLDGHIPGAILVDHYQQERYLTPELLDRLRDPVLVIVYCNGDDCPDSISLATDLVYEQGVPLDAIRLYEGGIQEWSAQGRPVERP